MVKYREYTERFFSPLKPQLTNEMQSKEVPKQLGQTHTWGNVLFTLPTKENHTETVVQLINHAVEHNKPLYISSFIVSYQTIVDHLIEAASKLQGKIFLITAIDKNELRKATSDSFISSTIENNHLSALNRLSRAGVRIRNFSAGHWKLFLVGDEAGFITSANFSKEAYKENPEIGVLLRSKNLSRRLAALFQTVWLNYCTKELIERRTIDLEQPGNLKSSKNAFAKFIAEELELWSTLGHMEYKKTILAALAEATSSIDIICYSITHKEVIRELNRKAEQGIQIRIILPILHSLRNSIKQKIDMLDKRINIRYFLQSHAKAVIIDQKKVFISTGNLDKHLDQALSLDLAVSSTCIDLVEEITTFFDYVYNQGQAEKTTEASGLWEESRQIKLQVESALQVAPWISISLLNFILMLKERELAFHSVKWEGEPLIILRARKVGERDNFFVLEGVPDGFFFKKLPWHIIIALTRNSESVTYQELEITFYWQRTEVEEEIVT